MRRPRWLLVAWILSTASLAFAASQTSASNAALDTPPSAEAIASGPVTPPDVRGRQDNGPLEERDAVLDTVDSDTDGLTSSGFEDFQYAAVCFDCRRQRTAIAWHAHGVDATLRAEPRFLRYSRLLN